MSAVVAVRHLLANYPSLVAIVPAARIMLGLLPPKTTLPAISITQVGNGAGFSELSKQSTTRRARVQVALSTDAYEHLDQILPLIRQAVARRRGDIAGVTVDSIVQDIEGPDEGEGSAEIFERSQDFIIRYSE